MFKRVCEFKFLNTRSWFIYYLRVCFKEGCEDGWTAKGQFCYKSYEVKQKWADAQEECKKSGALLAMPKTQGELTNVMAFSSGWVKYNYINW